MVHIMLATPFYIISLLLFNICFVSSVYYYYQYYDKHNFEYFSYIGFFLRIYSIDPYCCLKWLYRYEIGCFTLSIGYYNKKIFLLVWYMLNDISLLYYFYFLLTPNPLPITFVAHGLPIWLFSFKFCLLEFWHKNL